MAKSVVCIAKDFTHADLIINRLRDAGYASNDISVLMADPTSTREFAVAHSTKAPEGAAAGAGTGAIMGGALGWLTGIGALAIPGVGPLIAAGPIMAALGGAAVGGAVGGVGGALVGLGIPEFEATLYEGKVREGAALVAVHTESSEETDRIKNLLQSVGAEDITMSGEAGADVPARRPR